MKKIFILLMILTCTFITSCKRNPQPDEPKYHYDFKTKDEVKASLTTYRIKLEYRSKDNHKINYEIMENENGIYYAFGSRTVFIDKITNVVYNINENIGTKSIYSGTDLTVDSIKNSILDYLTAHFKVADSDFVKNPEKEQIAGKSCDVYELKKGTSSVSTLEKYYVYDELGFCLKASLVGVIDSKTEKSEWEINTLDFDNKYINLTFNKINDYQLVKEQVQYDKWPATPLGKLLPELREGTFIVATDNDEVCLIQYKDLSESNVRNYIASLKNYSFNTGKTITNEAMQLIHVTYNDDNILVYIKLDMPTRTLSIEISRSTKEAIQNELDKLK